MSYFTIDNETLTADSGAWLTFLSIRNVIALRFANECRMNCKMLTEHVDEWDPKSDLQRIEFTIRSTNGAWLLSCALERDIEGGVYCPHLVIGCAPIDGVEPKRVGQDHPMLAVMQKSVREILARHNRGE